MEVGGVLGDRSEPRALRRQHAKEDAKVAGARDQLLDADAGDVQRAARWRRCRRALVGADNEPARLGHGEVAPVMPHRLQERGRAFARHRLGQVMAGRSLRVGARSLGEQGGHHVGRAWGWPRHHDRDWGGLVGELLDALAKVRSGHLDARLE